MSNQTAHQWMQLSLQAAGDEPSVESDDSVTISDDAEVSLQSSLGDLTLEQQCAELGRILMLDGPVSNIVMEAAIANPTYANNLLICRREPGLLQHLLSHPPKPKDELSVSDLLSKGALALMNWARAGFTVVDDEVYRRRLEACQQCPELKTPAESKRLLYELVGVNGSDKAMCALCGCAVKRKARLTTERCPAAHPLMAGHTRWAEPISTTPQK
jgi:hypothetical protein